jgi:6-pyruvoyltetrahydropterin/6-carboxytetrahydropterin synthase
MKLGIVEYIDCAHHLPDHGKCGSQHGHTYKVELQVEGEPMEGMLIDFADLKRAVREVLSRYDHGDWNDFLEYPSVENICQALAQDLSGAIDFPFTLRVWEGHGKWAQTESPGP